MNIFVENSILSDNQYKSVDFSSKITNQDMMFPLLEEIDEKGGSNSAHINQCEVFNLPLSLETCEFNKNICFNTLPDLENTQQFYDLESLNDDSMDTSNANTDSDDAESLISSEEKTMGVNLSNTSFVSIPSSTIQSCHFIQKNEENDNIRILQYQCPFAASTKKEHRIQLFFHSNDSKWYIEANSMLSVLPFKRLWPHVEFFLLDINVHFIKVKKLLPGNKRSSYYFYLTPSGINKWIQIMPPARYKNSEIVYYCKWLTHIVVPQLQQLNIEASM